MEEGKENDINTEYDESFEDSLNKDFIIDTIDQSLNHDFILEEEVLAKLLKQQKGYSNALKINATVVGFFKLAFFPVFFYIKNCLNESAANQTGFQSIFEIPWFFKPFLAFLSDFVFPFKYRKKIYFLGSSLGMLFCTTILSFHNPSSIGLLILVTTSNFCLVLGDTIAVGLTSTSYTNRLAIARLQNKPKGSISSKTDYANYAKIRYSSRMVFQFIGGVIAERVPLKQVMLFMTIVYFFYTMYFIFLFKEEKTNQWIVNFNTLKGMIKSFGKLFTSCYVLIPLIFLVLVKMSLNTDYVEKYMLISLGKWNSFQISLSLLINGVLVFIFITYAIEKTKKSGYTFLLFGGVIIHAAGTMLNFPLLFIREIPFVVQFCITPFRLLTFYLQCSLPLFGVIERINLYAPVEIQSTCTNLLTGINNMGDSLTGVLTKFILEVFGVKAGHYDNFRYPIYWNCAYGFILILISPLFILN